ncbi:OmpL47-type beta-barrel domain-containing protein [Neobacillus cucumis]|uniref:Fibronectin type-III domain-containing protein n=1 Tax=Neobacillus cucumis TaxID=1740721 RepID=A0A2N5H7F4_9BACI|nr:hypothetical protein [Neobacillus cucumis]PLS01446.1 hypothetical protein CVD27_25105 [Neobacillus cucumis]
MQKNKRILSFFVLVVLLFQLISPITSALAASTLPAPANLRYSLDGVDNVILRWDAVTGASVYRVYEIKGEERVQISQTSNLNRYFPTVSAGTHTYAVTAVNSAGESPLSTSIDVVIKYPDMQPPSGVTSTIFNGNDVSLKWNAVEFANGYKIYEVKDGQRELLASVTTLSKSFTNVSEGQHTYELTSYNDKYGESQANSFIVNVVYPVMAAPDGLTSYIYDINNTTLSWKEVAFADSYNVYQLVDGQRKLIANTTNTRQYIAGMPEGQNVYEVTSYSSRFGESKTGSQINVTVDYPDMLPPDQISSYFYNGNDVMLTWTSAKYATNYQVYKIVDGDKELIATTTSRSYYFSNLPEGDYIFEIVSVSDRFGESAPKAYDVTVDFPEMQAPKAVLTMDTANSAMISWSAIPYATEYEIYELVNGVPTLIGNTTKTGYSVKDLPQGKHEYMVIAKSDRFGKSAYSNVVVAEVNPVLPAPEASKPEVNGDTTKLTWQPVEEAVKYNVYEVVDGERVLVGTTTDPTITVDTPKEEGTHEYIIVPVASDGTESIDYATVEVEVNQPSDVTAPVTVADPDGQWSKDDVTVKLTATDDLSGVKSTYYSINHSEFVEGTELTIQQEGINTVSFYSVDNAGNIEEVKSVDVKIDKQAPESVINASEYWYKDKVDLELTAADDLSGVQATYYSVNGSDFKEGTSFTVDQEGVNTVSFYSIDNAGNFEIQQKIEVVVDKTAPVTVSDVKDQWYTDSVNVKLTARDDLSGVKATYYSIDGADFSEGTNAAVGTEGVHQLAFYSVDNAGNIEEQKTVEVKIDKTAPVIKAEFPAEYALGSSLDLTYEATDNLSGIKESYVEVNGVKNTTGQITLDQPGVNTIKITAIDNAGLKTVVEKTITAYIEATIEVTPKVINCNNGEFTVRATLPKGYSFNKVDLTTVTINHVHALSGSKGLENQAKTGQFKFERDDFVWDESKERLVFRAVVDGVLVMGSTTVDVINNQKK